MGNGNGKQTTTGKKARLRRALFVVEGLNYRERRGRTAKFPVKGKNGSKSGFELHSGPLGGAPFSGALHDRPSHMHACTESSA